MGCHSKKVQSFKSSGALLKFVNRFRNWGILQQFCNCEQKLTLDDFKLLLHLYKRMRSQKNIPDAVYWVEDMFFHHSIIPQGLKTADDVREWNKMLVLFLKYSGNASADDEEIAQELVFNWWQSLVQTRYVPENVFKLIKNSDILASASWRGVFPKKVLLKNKCYKMLLHCGEVETLVAAGQSDYVIKFLNRFDITKVAEKVRDEIYHWTARIPIDVMNKYLHKSMKNFCSLSDYRVFAVHPQGLQCLMAADCFGLIANLAAPLRVVAGDYPKTFSATISQESYLSLLSNALDEKV
ncbi:MAG: hypothetical protein Q4D80_06480 [Pseudomonadota bacterium]|nr:hypothetical protein [Pseudomonadota bacterium]